MYAKIGRSNVDKITGQVQVIVNQIAGGILRASELDALKGGKLIDSLKLDEALLRQVAQQFVNELSKPNQGYPVAHLSELAELMAALQGVLGYLKPLLGMRRGPASAVLIAGVLPQPWSGKVKLWWASAIYDEIHETLASVVNAVQHYTLAAREFRHQQTKEKADAFIYTLQCYCDRAE